MLVHGRGLREAGRSWLKWGGGDDSRGLAGVAVAALEKVVHAFAAHDRLEGEGALQSLQLRQKQTNKHVSGLFLHVYNIPRMCENYHSSCSADIVSLIKKNPLQIHGFRFIRLVLNQ